MEDLITEWRRRVEEASGAERIVRIRSMLRSLFPGLVGRKVLQNVLPGVIAFRLIENLSRRWLGDAAELASLGRSPPGNVTTNFNSSPGGCTSLIIISPLISAISPLRSPPKKSKPSA